MTKRPTTPEERARRAAYMREWAKRNPERTKAIAKASKARHLAQRKADNRAHYQKNSKAYKSRAALWKIENPVAYAWSHLNHKASKRGVAGRVMLAEYNAVVLASGGHCFWCDGQLNTWCEFDHPMPFKLGGDHIATNLVLACRGCNQKKACQHPADFNRERWERFTQGQTSQ